MNASKRHYLKQNSFLSALTILRDWAAIILLVIVNCYFKNIWIYLPSVWLIGAFQFALSEAIVHEACHHNLFSKKSLNYNFEFLYSLPFFRTVKQFKQEHIVHHNHLGKSKDHLQDDYTRFGLKKEKPRFFWIWFLRPITGFPGCYYIRRLSLKPFPTEGIKIVIFWILVVGVFYYFDKLEIILFYWIIPMIWSSYSYLYWSEITDHYNSRAGTRSNLNRLYNIITHNNGYHYIHHKYPTIPWHNLRRAHSDLLKDEQGDISTGFVNTYKQISNAGG